MSTALVSAPAVSRTVAVLGWIILFLATVGLVLSAVTLRNHYRTDKSTACDIGQGFDCDLVNRGPFSMVGPAVSHSLTYNPSAPINRTPVAAVGIAGYALLMLLGPMVKKYRWASLMVLLGALVGMAFALNLTYIEARILYTWCIYCLGSQTVIALILLLSIWQTISAFRSRAAGSGPSC